MTTATPTRLGWDQVLAWRVGQQHLAAAGGGRTGRARRAGARRAEPVDLVARLAGVQAQVQSSAAQVLAVRGAADVDLDRLLWRDRTLVKTWAMRGTLHLLPAHEWRTWIAVLRRREWRITPGWVKYHGITEDELHAVTAAIPEALAGEPLTREELAERIAVITGHAHLGEQLRSGWAAVLKPAANRGLLCQGPPRGTSVTFTDPARWLGDRGTAGDEPDPQTAMATVLARFLDAYGPATRDDLARWLGVTPKTARSVLAAHGDDLVAVDVEGHRAWMTPAGARAAAATEPGRAGGVQLLPGFDPYVLAPISHRAHTIPDGRVDAVSRSAGWISPVLLVDGRVAGTWQSETTGDTTTVTVTPFAKLPAGVLDAARTHLEQHYPEVLRSRPELAVA